MKQSSTFDDVADHILLHEDGDLLTIHQESNYDAEEDQPPQYDDMLSEVKAMENFIDKEFDSIKNNESREREDVLSSFVSTSPSVQTIISKSAAKTKLNDEEEDEEKSNNKTKSIDKRNQGEDWI